MAAVGSGTTLSSVSGDKLSCSGEIGDGSIDLGIVATNVVARSLEKFTWGEEATGTSGTEVRSCFVGKTPNLAMLSLLVAVKFLVLASGTKIGRLLTWGTSWTTGAIVGKDCGDPGRSLFSLMAGVVTSARTPEIGAIAVLNIKAVRKFQRC